MQVSDIAMTVSKKDFKKLEPAFSEYSQKPGLTGLLHVGIIRLSESTIMVFYHEMKEEE